MKSAIKKANEIAENDLAKYMVRQQFDNPANPEAHEQTDGPQKIWRQIPRVQLMRAGQWHWHGWQLDRCLTLH